MEFQNFSSARCHNLNSHPWTAQRMQSPVLAQDPHATSTRQNVSWHEAGYAPPCLILSQSGPIYSVTSPFGDSLQCPAHVAIDCILAAHLAIHCILEPPIFQSFTVSLSKVVTFAKRMLNAISEITSSLKSIFKRSHTQCQWLHSSCTFLQTYLLPWKHNCNSISLSCNPSSVLVTSWNIC